MSKMIFAAFPNESRARAALDRLRGDEFKDGGISLLARQDSRDGDGDDSRERPAVLDAMFEAMTAAPDLEVDGHEVAGAGALPNLLTPAPDAGLRGLEGALVAAGINPMTARRFEETVRSRGLVLGVAAENRERTDTALRLLRNEGAEALAELDVIEDRRDRV